MTAVHTAPLRDQIDSTMYVAENEILPKLIEKAALSNEDRARIAAKGADLVRQIRASSEPGLMEVFLAE